MCIKHLSAISFLLLLLASCDNTSPVSLQMRSLESEIVPHPDSVLLILDSIQSSTTLDEEEHAHWHLLYTQAYDERTGVLPPDSMVLIATDHFAYEGSTRNRAYAYHYLGRMHQDKNENDEAMSNFLIAMDKAKEVGDWRLAGLTGSFMADLYKFENLNDEALAILKKSESYFEKSQSLRCQIFALRDIGKTLLFQDQSDSALTYYHKANYLAKSIQDNDAMARISQQMGAVYLSIDSDACSKYYTEEALRLTTDDFLKARAYLILGQVHYYNDSLLQAKQCYLDVLDIESITSYVEKDVYRLLYLVETELKAYEEAIKWNEKYITISDSLTSILNRNKIILIEGRYKYEKLQNENKQLNLNNQRNYLVIIALLLVLLIIYAIHQRRIISVNQKIHIQQDQLINMQKRQALLQEESLHGAEIVQKIKLLGAVTPQNEISICAVLNTMFNSTDITQRDWERFEEAVNFTYPDFTKRLKSQYPKLTEEDVKVLCLIVADVDTGQLSTLLNIQVSSVIKKRYRIRLKLGLRDGASLENFLKDICL